MSYDLNFWKYKEGVYLDNQQVYEKCSDEIIVEGLEDLPTEEIKKDLNAEFADWKMAESDTDWENPEGNGSFQMSYTGQFVRFDCYKMDGEDMNRLIDIMHKYGCPLYDPQVPKRYDGKE